MTDQAVPQVGGWRCDLENQAEILSRSLWSYAGWRANLTQYKWEAPKEIDPRPFWQVSDQGQMGSCQSNALADAAELCGLLANGEYVQLSRNWPYYWSQSFSPGLLGKDAGSTLDGGSKAAQQVGFVREEDFPYSDNYREGLARWNAQRETLLPKAAEHKMLGEVPLSSYDDIYHFLASGSGVVQIGVLWGVGTEWEITRYHSGGGGHSVLFAGYLQVANWPKPGLLQPNSWGRNIGREGWQIWHPDSVEAACRTKYNVFVGRGDARVPVPRPIADI